MIRVFVGFDQRESVACHTSCRSFLEKANQSVAVAPLVLGSLPGDGAWVTLADDDTVCRGHMAGLWALRDASKAVQLVPHDDQTEATKRDLGNKNQGLPHMNGLNVMLLNRDRPKHRIRTPEFLTDQVGALLHRFQGLDDAEVSPLPSAWNGLSTEYKDNDEARPQGHTLGMSCAKDHGDSDVADGWQSHQQGTQDGMNV